MAATESVLAVVLTGGRSSRMGGRHKPSITVGGRSVIDRLIYEVRDAAPSAEIVVAGSDQGLSAPWHAEVRVVREDPPFAGPVAGLAAGVAAAPPADRVVVVLGGDMPFISATTIAALISAVESGSPVASCLDASGHLQYLCAAWREHVLRQQLRDVGAPSGVPLRALFDGLSPTLIEADPEELRDIDTPQELARAVTTADGRPVPEQLLLALERLGQAAGHDDGPAELHAEDAAAILDFAREVKHSPSAANPAVAAFMAGQRAGQKDGRPVSEVLQATLDQVSSPSIAAGEQQTLDHLSRGGDISDLPASQQHPGQEHRHRSG